MKKTFLFTLLFITIAFWSFKPVENREIKWMTWDEVQAAQKKEPRKIVIDVYTDWCGWCKRMDATTFVHPEIVKYVGEKFYAVKFDAETRETIRFTGKEYHYVSQGTRGYNQLAAEMLNGKLSYPTTVYLDENLNEIFPVPGYLDPSTFETVLNFIASNSYKTMPFDQFQKTFKGKVK